MQKCCWSGCTDEFENVAEFVSHISDIHLISLNGENTCLWMGCDRFGQSFHNRSSLNAHIRRHTGEKPFTCAQCQKSFSRSDALSKHAKSHTENLSATSSEKLSLNEHFGPIDYILKEILMENMSLKRKLYLTDLKKKRLTAHKLILIDSIKDLLASSSKSNS